MARKAMCVPFPDRDKVRRMAGCCTRHRPDVVPAPYYGGDLDFSNPFVYPPEQFTGIVVIRLPNRATPDDLFIALSTLVAGLVQEGAAIVGKLWIVDQNRIRVYLPK